MGLAIVVGILADLAENDPESVEDVQAEFESLNAVLRAHGLPEHVEPTALPPLVSRDGECGFPYSFLHHLRRFYAHWVAQGGDRGPVHRLGRLAGLWGRRADWRPPPVAKGENPANDPILDRIGSPRHHLLWHSDCEGCYLPLDFPEVLQGEGIAAAGVGSSVRLREELIQIAAPLGITLHDGQLGDDQARAIADEEDDAGPFWIERKVWLALFEASRLSIAHRAAIAFT